MAPGVARGREGPGFDPTPRPALPYALFPPEERALLSDLLLALPMLLFALVAHEVAHGWAALRQGDDTAYKLGRLTFNPLPHIDPVMTLLVPVALWVLSSGQFTFGGARPVPITPRNFRNYRRGDLIVSSAGVVTNFVIALALTALWLAAGGSGWGRVIGMTIRHAGEWLWLLALLGLARRFLDCRVTLLTAFSRHAFPFYIAHQAFIVVLGWFWISWNDDPLLKYFTVALLSLAASLAFCRLADTNPVTRFLVGLKRSRA